MPDTTTQPPTKPTLTRAKKKRREWKPEFLRALETEGTVSAACAVAGIHRSTAYDGRQHDETFALAWADVESKVTDAIERKGVEMALNGDARMIEFMLKAKAPEKYRESYRIEHSGKIKHEPPVIPNDEERRQAVAALLAEAGALDGSDG